EFTKRLIDMRRRHRVFRRRRWFQGRPIHGSDVKDVGWFRPDGSPMDDEDWRVGFAKSLGVFLNGEQLDSTNPRGDPVVDDGYDVVDHSKVNAELGGEAGRARLAATLRGRGMGQLLDIVPNHMAIVTPHNLWWWDVLENGPSSRYAAYFDVDWDPPEAKLRNTVLLPVLADHYGRVLEAGELRIEREGGGFVMRYRDEAWPLAPASADGILAAAAERCQS